MGYRDVAASKHQVRDIAMVETAIRDAIGRGRGVKDRRRRADAHGPQAGRVVVIHRPATIGHQVREAAFSQDVVLSEHMVTQVAARLALAWQEPHPVDGPVVGAAIGTVLDHVPHAVDDA